MIGQGCLSRLGLDRTCGLILVLGSVLLFLVCLQGEVPSAVPLKRRGLSRVRRH
jgi:hypothetical protein